MCVRPNVHQSCCPRYDVGVHAACNATVSADAPAEKAVTQRLLLCHAHSSFLSSDLIAHAACGQAVYIRISVHPHSNCRQHQAAASTASISICCMAMQETPAATEVAVTPVKTPLIDLLPKETPAATPLVSILVPATPAATVPEVTTPAVAVSGKCSDSRCV